MPPTITPQEFVAKWRGDTRKERSVAQEHFIDLCRMLGHDTPGDTRDGSLAFEAGVDKQKGGQGWADVWKKGCFAWEYKGPHADLAKAYQQIQQYREALQWPPGREPADDPRVAAISAAARDLVEKRDRWLNPPMDDRPTTNDESGTAQHSSSVIRPSSLKDRTLTNLYNQRPTWLDLAHTKLDRAVLDAYGWPHEIADEAILARLLALNLERAAGRVARPTSDADTE